MNIIDYIKTHEYKKSNLFDERNYMDYLGSQGSEESPSLEGSPRAVGSPRAEGLKYDSGKTQLSLVLHGFPLALTEITKVAEFGASKYTADGWAAAPNGLNRIGCPRVIP